MKKSIVFVVVFVFIVSAIFVIADTPEKQESDLETVNSNDVSTSINKIETVSYKGSEINDTEQQSTENSLPNSNTEIFPPEPGKVVVVKPEFNVMISGKVKLPDGKVAPKGGLRINIDAGINPNTMSYDVLRSGWPFPINSIDIVIPEGKDSASYEIPVVNYYKLGNKEYKPWYALMFYYNYTKDGSLEYQGDFYKGPLDLSQGNLENVDYTFESYNLN